MPPGNPSVCMDNLPRGDTVMSEVAIRVLSATLAAVTMILVEDDTVGAVNKPLALMVPVLACHTTAVLLVEVSVAENWMCPPEATLALSVVKFIWTGGVFVGELGAADFIRAHPVEMLVATV
jgi:hypothetical protein